ncbi:MAG: 50S ribosomal protein L25 [Anaerolineae bacterium]|nr:50S ribosomal protein L25 [Anaerolineae bacterium]
MAEKITLDAQARTVTGKKVGALRRAGLVPAVVYGSKIAAFNVQIPYRELQATLYKAGGTQLINISVDGKVTPVLAREVQRSVLRSEIMHVDFLAVDLTQTIRAEVSVHFTGEPAAVKSGAGVLDTLVQTLVIEALPADLINRIEVDVTDLKNFNDAIHVRDLKLGSKVVVIADPDEMLVRISAPEVQVEAVEGEVISAEPEVILKGKIEEEGEE